MMEREKRITCFDCMHPQVVGYCEDVCKLTEAFDMAIEALSADRPKNMIHIDDVYRLIAGHSDYHGDSILSAFTCLVEGKDVKPITPLNESTDRPTGEWNPYYTEREHNDVFNCKLCGTTFIVMQGNDNMNYCPNCGAKMKGGVDE